MEVHTNESFKTFLHNHSLEGIRTIHKSDLHNHFGKGGQSVSQEYLNLFNCGLMTVDELDDIRETGLKELDLIASV